MVLFHLVKHKMSAQIIAIHLEKHKEEQLIYVSILIIWYTFMHLIVLIVILFTQYLLYTENSSTF